MECGHQIFPERKEILLINSEQVRPDRHRGVAEEGEEAAGIQQQVREETERTNTLEYGTVHVQGLEVDP